MKVLVCGGRDYSDRAHVEKILDEINEGKGISLLIHGACGDNGDDPQGEDVYKGADRWAHTWARMREVHVVAVPANWTSEGTKAGLLRNQRMLEEYKPEMVVAFPGGSGTRDMVIRALRSMGPEGFVRAVREVTSRR